MTTTPAQRAMEDADRLGEIVHHALWPDCPRSLYPRLTDADRARYRLVAASVIEALGVREEQYRSASCPDDQDYDMVRLCGNWRPTT